MSCRRLARVLGGYSGIPAHDPRRHRPSHRRHLCCRAGCKCCRGYEGGEEVMGDAAARPFCRPTARAEKSSRCFARLSLSQGVVTDRFPLRTNRGRTPQKTAVFDRFPPGDRRLRIVPRVMERAAGIEPASLAWKAKAQPLYQARSIPAGRARAAGVRLRAGLDTDLPSIRGRQASDEPVSRPTFHDTPPRAPWQRPLARILLGCSLGAAFAPSPLGRRNLCQTYPSHCRFRLATRR